jgi:hypothetical protein
VESYSQMPRKRILARVQDQKSYSCYEGQTLQGGRDAPGWSSCRQVEMDVGGSDRLVEG